MKTVNFNIKEVSWKQDKQRIMMIREKVFVDEQNVPIEEEMDDLDVQCWFVLAEDSKEKPIGTGRLLPTGKIGRMAVLKEYRNIGVGSAILNALIEIANNESIKNLYLHGQVHAKAFYNKHGFIEQGSIFDEAGIPHYKMRFIPHY
jgi:predicted GNAT family N-acyltransferase